MLRPIALAAAAVLGGTVAAQAATITVLSDRVLRGSDAGSGYCNLVLNGPIEDGDADRLRAALEQIPPKQHDENNRVLCMNSPGGNLEAGLALGTVISEAYLGTYVHSEHECLSACAVAFMHGRIAFWEFRTSHRVMEPGARIGFHAPSLPLPDQNIPYPSEVVGAAYQAAVRNIAALSRAAMPPTMFDAEPILRQSLLTELLETPPDGMRYVETLHDAFLWGIAVNQDQVAIPADFDVMQGFRQACASADYTEARNLPAPVQPIVESYAAHYTRPEPEPGYTLFLLEGPFEEQCAIRFSDETILTLAPPYLSVIRYLEGRETDRHALSPVYMLPPETRLESLIPGR